MKFLSKESINSKELLKEINYFRKLEYQEKKDKGLLTVAQIKRGHYIELRHDTLLNIIRDEFNMKINAVNKNAVKIDLQNILETSKDKIIPTSVEGIFISTYIDEWNRQQPMFILTIDQAKQGVI